MSRFRYEGGAMVSGGAGTPLPTTPNGLRHSTISRPWVCRECSGVGRLMGTNGGEPPVCAKCNGTGDDPNRCEHGLQRELCGACSIHLEVK
jgi:hypothetical protein